jgi:hypothetical protein
MTKPIRLGRFLGLELSYERTVPVSLAGVFVLCMFLAWSVIRTKTGFDIIVAGLMCVAIHFLSEFIHQLGHAIAASRTCYPMTGIHFYLVLGRSLYPPNEPNLSPNVHIRRALGGPIISVGVMVVFFVLAQLFPSFSLMWFVFMFGFVDNLGVFVAGALMPLNFTDGGTILKNVRAQQKK